MATHNPEGTVLFTDGERAAFYVDGALVESGKAHKTQDWLCAHFRVDESDSPAPWSDPGSRDADARTLSDVNEREIDRSNAAVRADDLRAQAEALIAEADRMESGNR